MGKISLKNGIDIKTARINCGIKIKDISDKLGINIATMSNYENGLKIPREIFSKLCKEYKVKEEEIVANIG